MLGSSYHFGVGLPSDLVELFLQDKTLARVVGPRGVFCFFTLLCLQKKAGQDPSDFTKEKNYFQEVDSFELLEESPSPRNFGTWAMGTKHDIIVHDLPAILERWRISKLASRHGSQQLFKIMETPFVPSVHSTASSASNDLAAKTPERVFRTKAPLNVTSHKKILTPLVDNSIVSSFDALHIDEEEVANIMSEDVETSREGLDSDKLEEATQMDPSISQRASLTGEYLSTFDQLMMVCQQSSPISLGEVFSRYWFALLPSTLSLLFVLFQR
ncbi:hypothetical protein B296_00037880 [Ensete ventricosum]|uniref:Uncharacterized protein n=1 Tax=Ensete ventricosum TaxID=4639 RepID=A0A426Y3D7_ENSVE|nr:hypothetical protein B296_00037880 [Ensete ventricosum]